MSIVIDVWYIFLYSRVTKGYRLVFVYVLRVEIVVRSIGRRRLFCPRVRTGGVSPYSTKLFLTVLSQLPTQLEIFIEITKSKQCRAEWLLIFFPLSTSIFTSLILDKKNWVILQWDIENGGVAKAPRLISFFSWKILDKIYSWKLASVWNTRRKFNFFCVTAETYILLLFWSS